MHNHLVEPGVEGRKVTSQKVDFNEGVWFHKGHEFHHHMIPIGGDLKKQPMGSIGV
jgi:hypothetical protein